MGALADALANRDRVGTPSTWPHMVAALPDDAIKDLLAAFDDPTISTSAIKRAVEAAFPDAPVKAVTTWRNWRASHLEGKL